MRRPRHGFWAGLAVVALHFGGMAAEVASPSTVPLLVAGQLFELELAMTPERREHGLMDRGELAADRGMMFVFPDLALRRFWMKNTRIDLDIIYLDDAGRVVSTARMPCEPPRTERETETQYEQRLPLYPSTAPARFAIEFPAGTLSLLDLAPGYRLDLDVERLKAMAR